MPVDRRTFLSSSTALAASLAVSAPVSAQSPGTPTDARLAALFDRIFNDRLRRSREDATGYGLDKDALAGLRRQLDDRSPAAVTRMLAAYRRDIAALEAISEAGLSPSARLDREVVLYSLRSAIVGPERFGVADPVRPFVITQQTGAYFSVPDFLNSSHTINTAADAEAYLARLDAFATALDQDSATQRADAAARGLVAPDFSLDLALGQLAALRDRPAPESQLVQSLVRRAGEKGLPGEWSARATAIVERRVYPALDRQIALVRDLRARASSDAGVWRVKDGPALYEAALHRATTTEYSPAEVHEMGLRQVAEITARLDTLLKAAGLTQGDVGARLSALNVRADQLYANDADGRAALLKGLNEGVAAMQAKLPRAFLNPPTDPLEIRAVPVEIQDGASNGYYRLASLDGSRPAIYFVNLKDLGDWPKYSLPALTYHEGVPGHHLQLSLVQNSPTPLLRKTMFFGAYVEGWALYAEAVADELGGYADIERAGFLQSYLFRAARLVVDTGIHWKRWTREQATDYFVRTTGFARPRSQREVERYCVQPGQACSYKLGHNVWTAARARAEAALGPRFDLRQFHEVLRDGAVPLTILDRLVDQRIAAART